MEYKVGDKVRIKKDFSDVSKSFVTNMKKHLGKTMTVKYAGCDYNGCSYYYMEEDTGEGPFREQLKERHWTFCDDDIDEYAVHSSIKLRTLL